MLNFWKNAARGKSRFPTRPPEPPKETPEIHLRNGFDESYHSFRLGNIEDDDEEEVVYAETSRLSKNLLEILSDRQSLNYFLEYMDSISLAWLVEFWLEVEKFKTSAKSVEKCSSALHKKIGRTVSFDASLLGCDGNEKLDTDFKKFLSHMKIDEAIILKQNGTYEPSKSKSSILDSAIAIFKKFIALESPHRLNIPEDVRNTIVSSICHPEGFVDPDVFDSAQRLVYDQMVTLHFDKFVQSTYHCKYQIDILTSGSLKIEDIVYNQTALFYFMEYLEQEQCSVLLEFVMAVINFKQHLETNSCYDAEQAQNDAIVLYDKYFSLQATNSLGFSSEIRYIIEENVCREGGPSPDCFRKPFRLVLKVLKRHLSSFLASQLYYKYLSETICSIESGWSSSVRRHKKSASDCSSELSASKGSAYMRIDLKQLYNSDLLWRRKSDRGLSLGRVNSLGRFESSMEPDPEKKDPSIIKRVVNKLVHGESDKAKEELAWQVAHMIVKDVTDVTMGIPDAHL